MFAIDPRSLALFRILMALILFVDLTHRALDVHPFYTDEGLVPRVLTLDMLGYGETLGFEHQWSIHLLNGEAWTQLLLIGIAMWFAFWLLIGYRTRLAAIASWILITSLNNRNPLILDAGDSILRAMLFWSLFLPLGIYWSIDRSRMTEASREIRPIYSVASAVLLLQLALMYLASASFKFHPVWTREFSAVYYTLHGDTFVTPFGLLLRDYFSLTQILTGATVTLELLVPLIAFCPWRNAWCRGFAIGAFTLFHIGLACTLTLGFFPWICIACWLLFLPPPFWDWLKAARRPKAMDGSFREKLTRAWYRLKNLSSASFEHPETPRMRLAWWKHTIVGLLFAYIVLWNIRELLGPAGVDLVMPHRFNGPAIALGLGQNWSMFAPVPRREDGWLVMKGVLRDGTEVNLWEPNRPLPWQKPALVSAMFPSSRWRRYLENLPTDQYALHRQYLADWLQRRWNKQFAGGVEEKEVARVEIIRLFETTPPPGDPIPEPEPVELCVRHY